MDLVNQGEGFLTLLRKRNFLRLWLAQLISMTIFNASNYAVLILIDKITGSTTLIGVAIICFSLPAILFGAPAGVFVDHMNKHRVLWASNMLRAAATFLFVLTLLVDEHLLLPIYLLTFLISSIGQFFTPAEGSAIPLLVSDEELMPALSLFNITFMLSQALGYVLFAPIILSLLPTFKIFGITVDSIVQLYTIISLLYLVCAGLIMLIPSAALQRAERKNKTGDITAQTLGVMDSVWHEMYQGWSFVRRNKQLFLAVIQLSFAGVLILVIGQLATPIVTQLLKLPPTAMAFVFAPAGIGLVAGSVFMPRITRRLGRSRTIFSGTIALTISTLLLPLLTLLTRSIQPATWNTNPLLLFLIALCMFAAGVALDFVNIPAQTAIQELTPDWIKGRVLALQLVLYNACSIPVILFIGATTDLFGIDRVLYLLSACEIAFGLWGLYYERKHAERTPPTAEENAAVQTERDTIAPSSSQSH
ncbi:MAG TPA: MFS transporter [Ktedonosporobacter sp.]|jgi:MFS family permease|nr:MFS transporter [Ktedonosporobacter sp.]